jgi:[ribosomal protein S5]-alanine N-acetyltransferase
MIVTQRLLLSPLAVSDAEQVQRLFRDPEIYTHNLNIPQPFDVDGAETWIKNLPEGFKIFAIKRLGRKPLVGVTGLLVNDDKTVAEYGCWIAVPYRGKGFGSEASKALFWYGFKTLGLNRIFTSLLNQNTYSIKILKKLGMHYEGCLRQHVQYWGHQEDLHIHGLLREQYLAGDQMTPGLTISKVS